MRGTLQWLHAHHRYHGIIPAYAGNTFSALPLIKACKDHPRVCGEHTFQPCLHVCRWGSSPRMRGTPRAVRRPSSRLGIIPAYAGNTQGNDISQPSSRDHPRVCGEHYSGMAIAQDIPGSSPRMRGTLMVTLLLLGAGGIIPAYAGNTMALFDNRGFGGDHPRVCGEHPDLGPVLFPDAGSSPRMRGTPCNNAP